MTTREVLVAARARINTPEKWSDCGFGWDGRRCMSAAIADVQGADPWNHRFTEDPAWRTLREAVQELHGSACTPAYYNDSHTHAEVLAAFDKAIAGCEA